MARVYATIDDLTAWIGEYPPVNADVLLARASLTIEDLTVGVRYDVDGDQLPTDQAVIDAMRDAVCAQVAWWLAADQGACAGDAASGCQGGDPRLKRFDLNQTIASTSVAPDALKVLHVAGLQPAHIRMFG